MVCIPEEAERCLGFGRAAIGFEYPCDRRPSSSAESVEEVNLGILQSLVSCEQASAFPIGRSTVLGLRGTARGWAIASSLSGGGALAAGGGSGSGGRWRSASLSQGMLCVGGVSFPLSSPL